jgi:4-diphosphocytidyl-2-C-methyl-D-erythritol kinase
VTQANADNDGTPRTERFRGVSVVSETARAKVNLTLEILGRRPDGYHELRSLVAFAAFGDTVRLDDSEAPFSLRIEGPFASALEGGNLIQAAAELYARAAVEADDAQGMRTRGVFRLTKRIPVAAGLGGGSADAAAALRLLARRTPRGASLDALLPLAAKLGADIPVCLRSKPAIMTGIGERLTALPIFPEIPAVLVNPRRPLATTAVFRDLRSIPLETLPPACEDEPVALRSFDAVLDYARHRRNDLEPSARRLLPVVGEILNRLEQMPGAVLARLSGSGPTCFALFRAAEEAATAARTLRSAHPDWWIEATALA